MLRTCSERCASLLVVLALLPTATAAAQSAQGARRIVSSQIAVSRDEAKLDLELEGGRRASFSLRAGQAFAGDEAIGPAPRGESLDRSWRNLLARAMDVSGDELAGLLVSWDAPGEAEIDRRLQALLGSTGEPLLAPAPPTPAAVALTPGVAQGRQIGDSVERLVERITELQERLEESESRRIVVQEAVRDRRGRGNWVTGGPFRHVVAGAAAVFRTAIAYGLLFALAFATIFFGGRRFIEGVADTARAATARSFLVGLAASFLVIPVFILGIVALAISIVGIPALLAWVPLFPVAVGLALILGYISVAHAAGESMAERRFYATDWFQRGNSYYFLITGLAILLAPFVAMSVLRMAGPWLSFLHGIFVAVAVIGTWAAFSIGLGAVLISRAGTRPLRAAATPEPEIYAEQTRA